jgi:hypothetical protein
MFTVYVHVCVLGGSFRRFRFRCSRFSVATPLTVVHHFLPLLDSLTLPPSAMAIMSGACEGDGPGEDSVPRVIERNHRNRTWPLLFC